MGLFQKYPSTDFDEKCFYPNETSRDGDCNGENFTIMCIIIDIFSGIIVVVNLVVFVIGIVAMRRKIVHKIRICEFYLILNLAFSDMVTGALSLLIDVWDYIAEVGYSSFRLF